MDRDSAEPVFVGLGSNMANPAQRVAEAIERLANDPLLRLRKCSSLYISPPWGDTDQAEFVNAVALVSTGLTPQSLLQALSGIETDMGRKRSGRRWGPRLIDLDLLAFGDRTLSTTSLQLPHPRIAERSFVLVPLAEIAPDFQLPGIGMVKHLLTLRDDAGNIRRLKSTKSVHESG